MTWRVTVDQGKCMGTGLCAGARPDRFVLDGSRSRPVQDDVEPDEDLLDVAETCPAEAIAVHAADGARLAPEE